MTVAIALAAFGSASMNGQSAQAGLNADALKAMTFRNLGPTLNPGRIVDVELDPKNPNVWYVASAFGGVWKTINRGITFDPIFSNYGFTTCCVVVDPKDSNVVWVGSGENASQRSAHFGDGVYKSTDAGKTFKNMGLRSSEHIGKIIIDPRNSNTVWVAAQGPLFSEGGERSLYKTTDGGNTWTAALTINKDTGVSDIVLDPNNPDIIYAGSYQRRRHVGQMIGGGPDGGIWKSMDGGKKFSKLTNGLPKGDVGRIALAIDPRGLITAAAPAKEATKAVPAEGDKPAVPAKPATKAVLEKRGPIVYAIVNATVTERGFYRSVDGGLNWEKMSSYFGGGAAYYCEIFIDPHRLDTIWSVNTPLEWSRDGGKTFVPVPNMSNVLYGGRGGAGVNNQEQAQYVHVDFHDVTFDPTNADHIIASSDGGVHETYDGGLHWRPFMNMSVHQFYKIAVDDAKPFYRVCGGAQDNFSSCAPSRTDKRWGVRLSEWFYVSSGDGFQPRMDPSDQNIIYGSSQDGNLVRNDLRTGASRGIRPRDGGPGRGGPPAGGRGAGMPDPTADRPNWDAPYIISPHSPTRLYWASQYVWRSDDRGDSWTKISGDLTRNLDWRILPIMGRVWDPPPAGAAPSIKDPISLHESTTALSNVVALDESPLMEGLIYAGTDDGLLQITEDAGKTWRKVEEFPGVAKWAYISDVFASPRDSNTVFVALNNWQRGDYAPYIVKSTDRGRTFTNITGNLPAKHDVWGIIQDHINGDLLFAGTEFGAFTSVDGGKNWIMLKGNMPLAQVRDIQVQKAYSDLVLGTFGRGIWILDDFSALRGMTAQSVAEEAKLYPTRDTALLYNVVGESQQTEPMYSAPNPELGAMMTYSVGKDIGADAKLVITFTDGSGRQIRRMDVPKTIGINRVMWNLRADVGVTQAGGPGLIEPTENSKDEEAQQTPPPAGRQGGAGQAGGANAPAFQGRGGGAAGGAAVVPGRYTATLGKMVGETVTPYGAGVSFVVKALER